ncbi:L-lysine 6-transaminase [Candidatus Neomarinimicrobiota bacterium]
MTANITANKVHDTLGKHILADGLPVVIDLEKSKGSTIIDGVTGKSYLDMFSMFASMAIGYNHPALVEKKNRLVSAAVNKPTLSDIYSREYAEFVAIFGEVGIPDYLPHAFFIEGGGLAVENALKAAFDWKVRKNMAAGRGEQGSKVIHFEKCFHGRTGYTMSMTDSPDPRKTLYFPKFDWPRVSHPSLSYPLTDKSLADVKAAESKSIEQIKKAITDNPHEIAAMIIEPIQGEGGDNHIRPEFARQLRQICDQEEIILIYDEVQTGVGITGTFWAHEQFGPDARPDVLAFGKKSQVCGILASKRFDEVENNVFNESSRINSTWGGNLVDMVRFGMILEVIKDENLLDNATTQGKYLVDRLEQLQVEFPGFVTNARGKGLFAAFDLPSGTVRDAVLAALFDNGAIVLGCGLKSIRFRPHLNVTRDTLDQLYEVLVKSVRSCLS